jgi:hypothetical protein
MSDPRFLGISTTDSSHHDPLNSSTPTPTSPFVSSTRTVAIIKPHAVDHRFEIEHRISEAKFEVRVSSSTVSCASYTAVLQIVKERQMEFDMETDPDALFELFGDDARSFAE